ncbi:MAG: DUF5119 domain-containing protein [Bacteroidaceae bacterium]|nr:DUF5119 domain-containing protein [Bacteroidaceae bacterium]
MKSNKTIAKIQIILGLAIALFSNSACVRKDLYLRVDQTQIAVEISDIRLDLLWGIEWETEWQYNWNETSADFGTIGYTKPELIKGTIYNVDRSTGKRYSSFLKVFDSNGGRVSLTAGSVYDMMFYNFGTEWTSFYESNDYETYTASTRMSSQASWIRTRAENENSEMPDTTKSYIDYNQPDELFGTLVTGLEINEDPTCYEKEYDENGNITYIYKVDAQLRPYSFIYVYQVVLLNNADSEGDRVKGAKGVTVTGLAQGVEMFSRKTFNNTISITTEDIKPLQNHDNVRLEDGTTVDNADIFATRILTWGLPGINPLELTKASTRAAEIDQNFIGIGLTLRNGYIYTVTRDITDQMHNHPTGGVITIYIDANDIPQDILDQKQQNTGGGFNAHVEDWANEVNAEVTI